MLEYVCFIPGSESFVPFTIWKYSKYTSSLSMHTFMRSSNNFDWLEFDQSENPVRLWLSIILEYDQSSNVIKERTLKNLKDKEVFCICNPVNIQAKQKHILGINPWKRNAKIKLYNLKTKVMIYFICSIFHILQWSVLTKDIVSASSR